MAKLVHICHHVCHFENLKNMLTNGVESYNCWVIKLYFSSRRGILKQEHWATSCLSRQSKQRYILTDLKMVTGYRCTIHTFSSISFKLGNFLNYGFIVMLWENLLTNCCLNLSRILQINRENKNTRDKTNGHFPFQSTKSPSKRHLASVHRHSSFRLDWNNSSLSS